MKAIYDLKELQALIEHEKGVLLYFSSDSCSVCKVLKPKVAELMEESFPQMELRYVNTELSPVLSGQHRVFTIPTILIFFDGKEQSRFSRNISIAQLEDALSRPYELLFGE